MTTDTALGVTKRVVVDRGSFPIPRLLITHPAHLYSHEQYRSKISHTLYVAPHAKRPTLGGYQLSSPDEPLQLYLQDFPTIRFNARESVEMPFRTSLSFSIESFTAT